MTFTYDGDMSSIREVLRWTIQDVDTNNAIFTDEELDGLISTYGPDINTLAYHCFMAIAASASRIATMIRLSGGDVAVDRKQVAAECRAQAQVHFDKAKETVSATEIALEDKDITHVDLFTDPSISQEIDLTDLND